MIAPKRLVIPPTALSQWREKWPCLPAFDPVWVGDPGEVYVHEGAILEDQRVKAMADALEELAAQAEEYDVVHGRAVLRPHKRQPKPVRDARAALSAIKEVV